MRAEAELPSTAIAPPHPGLQLGWNGVEPVKEGKTVAFIERVLHINLNAAGISLRSPVAEALAERVNSRLQATSNTHSHLIVGKEDIRELWSNCQTAESTG